VGRRLHLTPELTRRICDAIGQGNYVAVACEVSGIARTTFYGWMRRGKAAKSGPYAEFVAAVLQAEAEAETYYVGVVHRAAAWNWQAAMTWLERKHPDRWGRRARVDVRTDWRQEVVDLLRQGKVTKEQVVEQLGDSLAAELFESAGVGVDEAPATGGEAA